MAAWRGDRGRIGDGGAHVAGVRLPHLARAGSRDRPGRPHGLADARFQREAGRRSGAHANRQERTGGQDPAGAAARNRQRLHDRGLRGARPERHPRGTSGVMNVNESVFGGEILAPYAARDDRSRGRRYPEPKPEYRTEYQRDRDRIIHSNAFRRLVYKTQVFVNHEGDLYRTRVTHSIEVAQIARSAARALGVNEALTEAICLAHDLGHTPFGHAGQDALNECMRPYGGFEHNLQSLRVVDELEERYAEFPGLNLTFECREGILKHCSAKAARELGDLGERFLQRTQPGLEAQIANLADEIAYNNHDVDDGIRAQLVSLEELRDTRLFRRQLDIVTSKYPDLRERRLIHEVIRRMINHIVIDLIRTSQARLEAAHPASIDDVRSQPKPLIALR